MGVIGTGSTATQITSAVVPRAAKFTLFQRTAQWIMPQANPAYTDEERDGFRRDPGGIATMRAVMSQVFSDGFSNAVVDASSPQMHMIEEQCRLNLETGVRDPALRERLRPSYRAACKRLVISPDFYEAIQRPNAELVTSAIERIEPKGVRTADGRLHELDVLVLATGFRADRFMRPTEVVGQEGLRLDDAWAERPVAYLSISIPGFPNLFMLNGPNGPVGNFSLIEVAELQIAYILQLVELMRAGRARAVAPSASATAAFDAARTDAAKTSIWSTGCKSWYLDHRGIPASWPWTFDRFRAEMSQPEARAATSPRTEREVRRVLHLLVRRDAFVNSTSSLRPVAEDLVRVAVPGHGADVDHAHRAALAIRRAEVHVAAVALAHPDLHRDVAGVGERGGGAERYADDDRRGPRCRAQNAEPGLARHELDQRRLDAGASARRSASRRRRPGSGVWGRRGTPSPGRRGTPPRGLRCPSSRRTGAGSPPARASSPARGACPPPRRTPWCSA